MCSRYLTIVEKLTGIVADQAMHGTVVPNELTQSGREVGFGCERVSGKEAGFRTAEDLKDGTSTMPRDPVSVGWDVGEDGVGGEPFGIRRTFAAGKRLLKCSGMGGVPLPGSTAW